MSFLYKKLLDWVISVDRIDSINSRHCKDQTMALVDITLEPMLNQMLKYVDGKLVIICKKYYYIKLNFHKFLYVAQTYFTNTGCGLISSLTNRP